MSKKHEPEYTPPKFRISRVAWEIYHTILCIGIYIIAVELLVLISII